MGEPVQLVKFVKDRNSSGKDKTRIEICEDNLNHVLSSAGNHPLCIITICGPSRQGKSFILGHMIRCLTALEQNEDADWMDRAHPNIPLRGFQWQNSTAPVTKGIWMWSKPFLMKNDEGDNITVILIDTQGTYDEFTTTRDMTAIVGISLLMSSIMIFNFFHNLQEDILNSLSNYIDFGLLALEKGGNDPNMSPFQKLLFLIRDWNNPDQFPYGWEGGRRFITTKLKVKPDQPKESQELREKMSKCFQSLDCFLMPPIGEKAKMQNYDGSIAGMGQTFSNKMEEFITRLMTTELMEKAVVGNTISKENFLQYLSQYVKVYNDADVPTPMSMMKATQVVFNAKVVDKALKKYQGEVKKFQITCKYLTQRKLEEAHFTSKEESIKLFKSTKKLGDKITAKLLEEELVQKINDQNRIIQRQNDEKRKKIVGIAENETFNKFKNKMDAEFTFPSGNTFYEDSVIREKYDLLKTNFLSEFNEDIEETEEEEEFETMINSVDTRFLRILDKIKEINEKNEEKARETIEKIVEELVERYQTKMNTVANDDCTETIGELQKSNKSYHEVIVKIFQSMDKPGNVNFVRNFEQKLVQQISSYFNTDLLLRFQLKVESMEKEGKQLVTKLEKRFEDILNEEAESDLATDEVETKMKQVCQEIVEQFKHSSPYPTGTKKRAESERQLSTKLENMRKTHFDQVTERTRQLEESYRHAIEEACKYYMDQMKPSVEKLLEDDELQEEHEVAMEDALEIYEVEKLENVKDDSDHYLAELTSKLESQFESIRKARQEFYEVTLAKLQGLVNECLKLYGEKMQSQMTNLSKGQVLNDDDARTSARETFATVSQHIQNEKLKSIFEKTLNSEMKKSFGQFDEFLKLKRNEENVRLKSVLSSVRKVYKEEMEKHLNVGAFLEPKELHNLHLSTSRLAHNIKEADLSQLTQGQLPQVDKMLEKLFSSFEKDNVMKLNTDKTLSDPAIGIDLGTTYCCVAIFYDNKVRVVPNVFGSNTTPSYVEYKTPGEQVVGEAAKDLAFKNPENTVFDAKRILGRRLDDKKLQEDMRHWPFSVVDVNGIPKLEVDGKTYHPEQVSATLLKSLKDEAEKFVKCKIRKAVITVPAYFSDGQRQATVDAGELAGFQVLDILNEPTAAAIAYKLERMDDDARNILVFDLGGGTFDVAILTIKEGNIEVLGVDGDTHLGGEDFDRNLMTYCAQEFFNEYSIDLFAGLNSADKTTKDAFKSNVKRLQRACEIAKNQLSTKLQITVSLDGVLGRDLKVVVTREEFEELNKDLFEKTIVIVERALASTKVSKDDINDIVLIGGSTRIPKIQQLLGTYFNGKALNHTINPDEAVAYGAAVHAAIKNGIEAKKHFNFEQILDVTPMSYGIAVVGDVMSVVIPKNSKIPSVFIQNYFTSTDYVTEQTFEIFQGEDSHVRNNILLGSFTLKDIPRAKKRHEPMPVEMRIDAMGILHVTASSQSTGKSESLKLVADKSRMSEDQKSTLIKDHEVIDPDEEEDEEDREPAETKSEDGESDDFDQYCKKVYDDEESEDDDIWVN